MRIHSVKKIHASVGRHPLAEQTLQSNERLYIIENF